MIKRISGMTWNNKSLSVEQEMRELEVCFYAELPPKGEDLVLPSLMELVTPTTASENKDCRGTKEIIIADKLVYLNQVVVDHAQTSMFNENVSVRIRRKTYVDGDASYCVTFKTGSVGNKLEAEIFADNRGAGFSAFNMLARELGNVLYMTRMKVSDTSRVQYEIDVPLMTGEHSRDYNATRSNWIKVDVEHDGNLTAQQAMASFPFPVKRFITDKNEIDALMASVKRNKK